MYGKIYIKAENKHDIVPLSKIQNSKSLKTGVQSTEVRSKVFIFKKNKDSRPVGCQLLIIAGL